MPRTPLLALAALWVLSQGRLGLGAEANHDFAKWEGEIAAFEALDRIHPPPKKAALFVGSSTIRLWKTLAQDFPGHRVINRGFGGSEIVDSTHFADRIIFPYEPRTVLLRAGGNDLHAGKPPHQVFLDFTEFVTRLRAKLPGVDIVFISLCPSPARWAKAGEEKVLNGLVREFALRTPGVRYAETYDLSIGPDGQPRGELFGEDRLHLNAQGYELLARRILPFLAAPSGASQTTSASNSLASVTITNRTVSQIAGATEAVFAQHYFQGGPTGPGQLTFERPGNRMNNLAYGDYFFDEKVTVRVTVSIQPVFGSQVLVSCNAWLVEDAGDAVFEDDHKVRKIRKWPYAKLLADIQKQLGE